MLFCITPYLLSTNTESQLRVLISRPFSASLCGHAVCSEMGSEQAMYRDKLTESAVLRNGDGNNANLPLMFSFCVLVGSTIC